MQEKKRTATAEQQQIIETTEGNIRVGKSDYFVTEACEYTNSFLSFNPKISIILNIEAEQDGALEIASRSRGTPRIANRLLKRVRDIAQVEFDGVITEETARAALSRFEIDELGLDDFDRKMLTTIIKTYGGGPVGLDTLAAAVGEDAVTIEDVYEPYLMQLGFISRTPRGRIVMPPAYEHFKLPKPEEN